MTGALRSWSRALTPSTGSLPRQLPGLVEAATPCVLLLSFSRLFLCLPSHFLLSASNSQEALFILLQPFAGAFFVLFLFWQFGEQSVFFPLLAPFACLSPRNTPIASAIRHARAAREARHTPQLRFLAHVDFPATVSFKSLPDAHHSALGQRLRDSESLGFDTTQKKRCGGAPISSSSSSGCGLPCRPAIYTRMRTFKGQKLLPVRLVLLFLFCASIATPSCACCAALAGRTAHRFYHVALLFLYANLYTCYCNRRNF